MERLKIREKIHFFGDIVLYEDELADNGRSVISIKIVSTECLFKKSNETTRFQVRIDIVTRSIVEYESNNFL